jgi:thioredoxin reductase
MVEVEVVTMTGAARGQEQAHRYDYDVAVIGGGAAGLNAAVVLGRARRTVIVIDGGNPRNAAADGVHSFLTRDGMPPGELIATGREEVERYGGTVVDGEAYAVLRIEQGFQVSVSDGRAVTARRLLVTTGLVDELPDVTGLRSRWGRDVVHCPYCHGWEIREQPIGVLGSSPWSVHQTLLFRQWTDDLVLFTHTAPVLTDEQAEQLAARGIRVVDGVVDSMEVVDDRLTGARMSDGTVVALQALVVGPRFVARSDILGGLGVQPTPHPSGIGEYIAADATGLTDAAGVWVAGNVGNIQGGVITAAAEGMAAAAAINADLIAEETEHALAARRGLLSAASSGTGPPVGAR